MSLLIYERYLPGWVDAHFRLLPVQHITGGGVVQCDCVMTMKSRRTVVSQLCYFSEGSWTNHGQQMANTLSAGQTRNALFLKALQQVQEPIKSSMHIRFVQIPAAFLAWNHGHNVTPLCRQDCMLIRAS